MENKVNTQGDNIFILNTSYKGFIQNDILLHGDTTDEGIEYFNITTE